MCLSPYIRSLTLCWQLTFTQRGERYNVYQLISIDTPQHANTTVILAKLKTFQYAVSILYFKLFYIYIFYKIFTIHPRIKFWI